MNIVFEVIDLNCQQADNSFFVPAVQMTTKSTTQFATLHGFGEFGSPSTPPKKYRKCTMSGSSKRVGFTAEKTPRQCAGAKYVWSGTSEYDLKGNVVSTYRKDFFAQCAKQFWPEEGLLSLPGEIQTSVLAPTFVGFCWGDWPSSCPTCDPDENNWHFLGNIAINSPNFDFSGFYALSTDVSTTPTTATINVVHNEITNIVTGQPYTWVLTGTLADNYAVVVGSRTYDGRVLATNPPNLVFPAVGLSDDGFNFHIAQYITFTDTSNHTAVLSEEYTDAMALANANTVQGTGKVAQNLPRTTGFTSVYTSVVFTLFCHNLIANRNYVVTVDFWDSSTNVTTPKQYPFTAADVTNTIIDTIPTPAAGHSTQVKNPRIAFA